MEGFCNLLNIFIQYFFGTGLNDALVALLKIFLISGKLKSRNLTFHKSNAQNDVEALPSFHADVTIFSLSMN